MKNNYKLGALLALVGIIAGLLVYYQLGSSYNPTIAAKISQGRTDEANTVRIVYAVLGWLGITAGAIWGMVLYGFGQRQPWAWFWGAVAATLQLLAGFFPSVPAMSSGLPAPTLSVFALAAVLWFGMLLIGGVRGPIIALTFVAGLAYVLTFMDGVAPISKFQTSAADPLWNGMYVMAQQINWWGSAAWAVFIFAVFQRRTWALPLGIFAGLMSMLGGYPLGIHNVFEVNRFSLFLPAPLISTLLVGFLVSPWGRRLLTENAAGRAAVSARAVSSREAGSAAV
jgi:hypothetical protein